MLFEECDSVFISTHLLIRPPVHSNGRSYKMLVMFFLFFLLPASLRRPSTNHRETLPHDWKLVRLDKFSPKIRGAIPPKKWGPKTCKISGNFLPLLNLTANISGTWQDIENRKDMWSRAIPSAFDEKGRWTLVHHLQSINVKNRLTGRLGGVVVTGCRTLWSRDREFNYRPVHCRVA